MFLNFIIQNFKFVSSIHKSKKHARVLQVILTLLDILLIGGILIGFFQTHDVAYLTTILAFLFCATFGVALRNYAKIQEKLLLRIINKILSTYSDWPSFIDKKISQEAEEQMEQNFGVELVCLFLSLTYCLYSPYFYFITKPGITFDHPDIQIVPNFYSFWKTPTLQQHLLKKFFEMLLSSTCMIAYLSFTIFLVYAVNNIEVHIKELNSSFENAIMTRVRKYMELEEVCTSGYICSSYVSKKTDENRKRKFLKSLEEELNKTIQYHQFIHWHITDITMFLQKPFSMMFAWYIGSTVLFLFVFIQIKNDYVIIVRTIILITHAVLALHLYCNTAHTIHQMNETIIHSLCNTSWYYLPPKIRKNLLLTLALCQRKYQVKAFGMLPVNLSLFIYGLRIVYSVINVIRITRNK